ncbi:MAG: CinA family nicotinamide mononucleotide deamidase-related protein [Peptoniphilaceae bacterium]|nr:CinA family nicotinamide mononucleotide deamidase-related protein [Peptoniphilaceae bacterium]MDD7434068.1 CinA family nicotinamide mononucleotide deamidase-related protein [Peptoniphilaceae bacterium]MDY3075817.1 CinA family nicotinamide mononucleotide deamidase-related protein [Peptoniphilaceae bacterium]MDY5842578.1 CinA family nicotinamide mononucleotide deamidase-related protein [Peptoniphilaceae bacterium]
MKAELISVGTEILLGDILNTDVQELSQACASLGIDVFHTSVVGDNPERLIAEITLAASRSDIIILSGGLGSTNDDITKETVIKFIGKKLEINPEAKKRIETWFSEEKDRKANQKLYYFPEDTTVLRNTVGTAFGAWIPCYYDGKQRYIAFLPGPPNELIPMLHDELMPILASFSSEAIKSTIVRIGLMGEHKMYLHMKNEMESMSNPTLAPYVKPDGPMIRITAKSSDEEKCDELISFGLEKVKEHLSDHIISIGNMTRAERLVALLKEKKYTVSTAESITGGMIASTIVEAPGASDVFRQGYITYSDATKQSILDVKASTIEEFSAVSEQTCLEMLTGLYKKTESNLCLAATGYAGPTGEDVGLTFIGVLLNGAAHIYKRNFHGSRNLIRRFARNVAIDGAVRALVEEKNEQDH